MICPEKPIPASESTISSHPATSHPVKKLMKSTIKLPDQFFEPILKPPFPGRRKYMGAYPIKKSESNPSIK